MAKPHFKNWKHFKTPFESMDSFTRHEPFPSGEVKATYIDGRKTRPGRRDMKMTAKDAAMALKKKRKKAGYY
jgi:hypothetical protein